MNFFKKILAPPEKTIQPTELSEEAYYTNLFIENSSWNTPAPNREEMLRWQIIEKFVYYINGYNTKNNYEKKLKILDVGCGRGWLSNLLTKYGNVTAIEPIKPVAEYAKRLFPDIHIQSGTAEDLLQQNLQQTFDIIVCSEVIEHVPDNQKSDFINTIKLLLKPHGFLILTTPRKDKQPEWMKFLKPGQPVEDWLSEAEVLQICQLHNFKKHLLERFSIKPANTAPEIEIYQLWLFQNSEFV